MRKLWRWVRHALETGEHLEFIHGAYEWTDRVFGIRAVILTVILTGSASAWAWVKGLDPLYVFIAGLAVLALTLFAVNQYVRFKSPRQTRSRPAIEKREAAGPPVLPEHQLRKYYSLPEAASIANVSEETLYQLAITGEIVLSIVEHKPQDYEIKTDGTDDDGRPVTITRKTVTVFSVGSDSPSLDLWYIRPEDAKKVIRNLTCPGFLDRS